MIVLKLSDSLPTIYIPEIKDEHIKRYGQVSNDFNALHFDHEAAQAAGFPGRIVHGMLTMGVSTKLISPWLSSCLLVKNYETTFRHPLILGDSLRIEGEIVEISETHALITFQGMNQHDHIIVIGEILLKEVPICD